MIVARLRGLAEFVEEEAKKVPVLIDILENPVLGREYKRGLDEQIDAWGEAVLDAPTLAELLAITPPGGTA